MKCKKIVAMCMTVLMLGSFAAAAHAEAEEPLPLVEEMLEELEETEEATEPEQPEKDTLPLLKIRLRASFVSNCILRMRSKSVTGINL